MLVHRVVLGRQEPGCEAILARRSEIGAQRQRLPWPSEHCHTAAQVLIRLEGILFRAIEGRPRIDRRRGLGDRLTERIHGGLFALLAGRPLILIH
jgi:hypothetical protein